MFWILWALGNVICHHSLQMDLFRHIHFVLERLFKNSRKQWWIENFEKKFRRIGILGGGGARRVHPFGSANGKCNQLQINLLQITLAIYEVWLMWLKLLTFGSKQKHVPNWFTNTKSALTKIQNYIRFLMIAANCYCKLVS